MTSTRMAALAVMLFMSAMAPASAETLQGAYTVLGTTRDWTAIRWTDEGQEICAARTPAQHQEILSDRGEAHAFLTREPGRENAVFSYAPGLRMPSGDRGARLVIDDETRIRLIGAGDMLFPHPEDDGRLIEAMRKGARATIEATGLDGTPVRDTISLMGVIGSERIMEDAGC